MARVIITDALEKEINKKFKKEFEKLSKKQRIGVFRTYSSKWLRFVKKELGL